MRISTLSLTLSALLALAMTAPARAQNPTPPPLPPAPQVTTPAPDPRDVASIDAIIAALYDVISGPAGQARDWNRFHSLFHPSARLMPTGRAPDGSTRIGVVDPAGYVQRSRAVLEGQGFFEREVWRRVERYGAVAHVWSTYESLRTASDPAPFMRGINTIQLFWDGSRWWVLSIAWSAETPDNPLPACYLPGAAAAPGADCPTS
ncbi:MAG TPA: hypothetical protein VFQ45_02820 [Longimicrobium sp.]|nr:hypothetical protein [Longimicrobium sp.]